VSLRHALLGVIKDKPLTGYDLVRHFQGTLGFLWSAPQSQLYPELRRMEAAGGGAKQMSAARICTLTGRLHAANAGIRAGA